MASPSQTNVAFIGRILRSTPSDIIATGNSLGPRGGAGLSALTDSGQRYRGTVTHKATLERVERPSQQEAHPSKTIIHEMTRSLRIAVLECDTPIDPVKAKFGGYGDIFEGLLKRGLQASNSTAEIQVSKWHVVENPVYPDPNDCDALLLTGSKHDAFADDQWILNLTEYVRDVVQSHQKPIVGICFGHQILARALGARVGRSDGWEVSVDEIDLTDAGKEVFGQDKLHLHQMHRDIVHEVPEGCINLGFSPQCAIQGLYMPKRLFSVQAHPEFNQYIMSHLLEARHKGGVFNDEVYNDGASRAGRPHDGEMLGKNIIKFVLEGIEA